LNLPEYTDPRQQVDILDVLPVLVFIERAGRVVFANREARQMMGILDEEWTTRPLEDVLWGLFPGTAEPRTLLTASRRGSPFHATMPARNGRLLPVEGTYAITDPGVREAVIVAHLGGREQAPKSRLMEDVLACIPEALAIEHGEHVLYTNPAFARMFGYAAEETAGASLRKLIVPETRLNEHATLARGVDARGQLMVETVRMNKAGELVDVNMQMAPLMVDGAQVGYVYTFRDIGDRRQTEAKLQHDAMHDVLTGLPNRALFLDRVRLALSRRVRRPDQTYGIVYFDLDRFKEINDVMGHAAGDVLLRTVAERLRISLRPQDTAARLGGDEFAVLVENVVSSGDLEIVAERILREMKRPFLVFSREVQSAASVGAALAGPEHTSAEMVIRDADFAMYRAKKAGGGRYEVFDKHLEIFAANQQERERELRMVIDKRLFEFRYQPVYRLASGKVEGFEALICRQLADITLGNSGDLLAAVEDTGLSIVLGRETLEAACAQLRGWRGSLNQGDLSMTVNVTQRQLHHPDLIASLKNAIAASGVDPSRLLIEVPESALNENPDAAIAILQRLVDCGVRVGVDEFGSSLAPLNHLVRLPISQVKLDSKLTAASVSQGRQLAVLESLIRLCQTLGMEVGADGIETEEQLKALVRMGCALGQGPLLSPPLEAPRTAE
jgi:Amt family ammonium transporter